MPEWKNGYFHFRESGFSIDSKEAENKVLITHAHADHFVKYSKEIWLSKMTANLINARYGEIPAQKINIISENVQFEINGSMITGYSAGHLPGSLMFKIQQKDQPDYLYTGDFHDSPYIISEPIHIPQIKGGILITECTLSDTEKHRSPAEEIAEELNIEMPTILDVYPLGKAQNICRLIHQVFPGRPVFIIPSIARFFKAYISEGFDTGPIRMYRERDFKNADRPVLLAPPGLYGQKPLHQFIHFYVSGINRKNKYPYSRQLKISDHADADTIKKVIQQSEASEVWFHHGNPGGLVQWCTDQGIVSKVFD